jgi:hypothetical protein
MGHIHNFVLGIEFLESIYLNMNLLLCNNRQFLCLFNLFFFFSFFLKSSFRVAFCSNLICLDLLVLRVKLIVKEISLKLFMLPSLVRSVKRLIDHG